MISYLFSETRNYLNEQERSLLRRAMANHPIIYFWEIFEFNFLEISTASRCRVENLCARVVIANCGKIIIFALRNQQLNQRICHEQRKNCRE